ncbi:RluA family pseudouridine synthase [Campylobacter mucosalis]|uniref:RNA pseudouridylate synthase n=1 Tax=Campylobacter mucosalis CCUG 21559 TaxID=1032067 RepID=A0A6G5QEC1_9BACT|nr:RluA family pseudouridine synthase [Campylobacter mucosalis]QCD43846.1 23S rRNA pseudouridine synthase, RluD family [Campylobacter mucosalis CCUG 21559]
MPYVNKKITTANGEKAYEILLKNGYDMKTAQRLIDRARLHCNGVLVSEKNAILKGVVSLIDYECRPLGLKPIYEFSDFAVFDKPSGVLSHPNGRHCEYSLNDEIWSLFGREASVAHRLDRETSGLIVVAKNRISQVKLKQIFESRKVKKSYLAVVFNRVYLDEFCVDLAMDLADDYDDIKTRMKICENGKRAVTNFKVLERFSNITLLRCYPITGRQHQIRLHLFHVGHKILGEPLYGLNKTQISDILDGKLSQIERINLTGANRLLLHADEISFEFDGQKYEFKSKMDFKDEIKKALKIQNFLF